MSAQPIIRSDSTRRKAGEWLIWIVMIMVMIFYLLPVYVMFINGLKEAQGVSLATMWNLVELTGKNDRRRLQ